MGYFNSMNIDFRTKKGNLVFYLFMRRNDVIARCNKRIITLFTIFFKISAVTVGGGLAMLPVIVDEFVKKRDWLSDEEMIDITAAVQSMPGIIAINMAVMTGFRTAGFRGAFMASFGVVLPPFLAIIAIATGFQMFRDNPVIEKMFIGINSAVCALMLISVVSLAKSTVKGRFGIAVAVIGFAAMTLGAVNVIWLVVGAAAAGLIFCTLSLNQSVKPDERAGE